MMNYFLIVLLLSACAYAAFVLWCLAGWKKLKLYKPHPGNFRTAVSVIIPARNEEKNLTACMQDILDQDYSKELTEIIVIDDNSTDSTAAIVLEMVERNRNRKILLLKSDEEGGEQYKKQAITKAVQNARGELIVTTDADCRLNNGWLSAIVSCYESEHPHMISSPVCFHGERNNFERLQSLEFSGLTGIGAGAISNRSPIMCNGANLAYTKKIFGEVNGFAGQPSSASGDDTQLMLKISKINSAKIHFLKSREAIVYTSPAKSIRELFQQRKRWASKIPTKMNALTRLTGGIAYILHLGLLLLIILSIAAFKNGSGNNMFPVLFFILAIKASPEYFLLKSMNTFYRKKNLLWLFLPAQLLYILYISIIGPASLLGSYTWKERTVRSSAVNFTA